MPRRIKRNSEKLPREAEASYTVEAAVLLPLYACLCVVVLLLFHVLSIQWGVAVSLNEAARKTALYGESAQGGAGGTKGTADTADGGSKAQAGSADRGTGSGKDAAAGAQVLARAGMIKAKLPAGYIRGRSLGISVSTSNVTDTDIELVASYEIPIPVRMFGVHSYPMTQRAKSRRWVGWDPHETKEDYDNEYVYVTETGIAYHKNRNCTYLKPSIRSVSMASVGDLRNSGGGKYYACPLCGASAGGSVYVTNYGECYHSSTSCSGLKRTIRMIPLDEARGAYTPCHKCGR